MRLHYDRCDVIKYRYAVYGKYCFHLFFFFKSYTLYQLATPVASEIDRLVPDTVALILIPEKSGPDSDSTDLMQSSCVRVCGGRG